MAKVKKLAIQQPTKKSTTKQPPTKQPPTKQPPTKQLFTKESSVFDSLQYMTEKELMEVDDQFDRAFAGIDVVLFWTGVEFHQVQKCALAWQLKTLTMAMGPLMDAQNPSSPKVCKSKTTYSRYVKGASGRFAQYACRLCRRVVVVTNPPPNSYSNRDNNTYQSLEEPILKGLNGDNPISRIDYVHPTVDGAAHITYQVWPQDNTPVWTAGFWDKTVKSWKKLNTSYRSLMGISQLNLPSAREQERATLSTQSSASLPHHVHYTSALPASQESDIRSTSRALDNGCVIRDKLCEKDSAYSVPTGHVICIEDHGSHFPDNRPEPVYTSRSHSRQRDHDQTEREIDFHEAGVLDKPSGSQTLLYKISKCAVLKTPTTVPIISINEMAVGAEITVTADGNDNQNVFLYLKMSTTLGSWYWKLE